MTLLTEALERDTLGPHISIHAYRERVQPGVDAEAGTDAEVA